MLTAPNQQDTQYRARFLTAHLLCLPLLLVFTLVGAAGYDDAHITFWQAWTLNHHGALLNYNGERIEQGSSLLHTLCTALLAKLAGLDEAIAGHLVALAAGMATVLTLLRIAERLMLSPAWLAPLLTSSSIFFSYWACSGMESSVAALCSVLFVDQCQRWEPHHRVWPVVAATVGLGLARPEMVIVGPLWLLLLSTLHPRWRPLLLPVCGSILLIFILRYLYFEQWFPNPVYAKTRITGLDPALEQLTSGMQYLLRFGRDIPLLLLAMCFAGCLAWSGMRALNPTTDNNTPTALIPWLLWSLVYTAFVIASGGDWMKEGRFWVPLVPAACLVVAGALHSLTESTRYTIAGVLLILQALHGQVFLERYNNGMRWSQQEQWASVFPYASFFERSNREHLRDLPAIAELERWIPRLYASKQQAVTILSKQMGFVNYSLGKPLFGHFKVMDMAGLTENSLRQCSVLAQDGFERQGMRLNYRKFFDRLPQATQQCGIQAPDIIYDIYGWGDTSSLPEYLADRGYRIVFHQTGRINMKPGLDVTANEVIAIRQALIPHYQRPPVAIDFNTLLPD